MMTCSQWPEASKSQTKNKGWPWRQWPSFTLHLLLTPHWVPFQYLPVFLSISLPAGVPLLGLHTSLMVLPPVTCVTNLFRLSGNFIIHAFCINRQEPTKLQLRKVVWRFIEWSGLTHDPLRSWYYSHLMAPLDQEVLLDIKYTAGSILLQIGGSLVFILH